MMVKQMALAAKSASYDMAEACVEKRNKALKTLAGLLKENKEAILQANRQDIALASKSGLSGALLERLSLENRFEGILLELEKVILLPDPLSRPFEEKKLSSGLTVCKYPVPLGVLGIIYESRPNVTIDVSALAIKSGNCVILRGGKEALHTNRVLVNLIQDSLRESGLSKEAVQFIDSADRSHIKELLGLHEYVDLIIPRGGSALQLFCRENTIIPVIVGGAGVCHLFMDESADFERSLEVILNAKTNRPSACNALDTLLVHEKIAPFFIPKVIECLGKKGVSFRLDPNAKEYSDPLCQLAGEKDWDTEWLDLILGIKIVRNITDALEHIRKHGSGHSEGILTENPQHAELFLKQVDAAAVYVNASTRFTDGGQFGLGSEVAVSTQKLHARGPMGLEELTSYKWTVQGNYHLRGNK
jgi:glutamate-5-semialdehyde dehydrogenase